MSEREWASLRRGAPVTKVSSAGAGDDMSDVGVFGLQLVDAPRLLVWHLLMTGIAAHEKWVTRLTLEDLGSGDAIRYQHLNAPWPFRDRHWVIHSAKNRALAEDTGGSIWQHRWMLEPPEDLVSLVSVRAPADFLSPNSVGRAIYLPRNVGAWAVIALPRNQTLVVAFVDAEFGGHLPKPIVRRFSKRRLLADFRRMSDTGTLAKQPFHEDRPLFDGHGRQITRERFHEALKTWDRARERRR